MSLTCLDETRRAFLISKGHGNDRIEVASGRCLLFAESIPRTTAGAGTTSIRAHWPIEGQPYEQTDKAHPGYQGQHGSGLVFRREDRLLGRENHHNAVEGTDSRLCVAGGVVMRIGYIDDEFDPALTKINLSVMPVARLFIVTGNLPMC